jgi:tRNA(Arg) A34 adenosine deaminase TadA
MDDQKTVLSHQCIILLPEWVEGWIASRGQYFPGDEEAMAFVISLAAENIRQGSGGPFGAAVVDSASGELISVGVNLVTSAGLSIAHAEMVAISLAQHRLGHWNLADGRNLSLVTSCEPCAMCFGAVPWSGVQRLICGARKSDAETAGFDEGDKPSDWAQCLRERHIEVEVDVLQSRAADVFEIYRQHGGEIYNAGPDE